MPVTIPATLPRLDFPCPEREAQIVCYSQNNRSLDAPKYEFVWKGPEDGIVSISDKMIETMPELFGLLPWRLRLIGASHDLRTGFFVRETTE